MPGCLIMGTAWRLKFGVCFAPSHQIKRQRSYCDDPRQSRDLRIVSRMNATNATESFARRFAIAVSFPGEHRPFVRKVVDRLAEQLGKERVFYDQWYESELVGLDGDLKLRRYYREQSEVVVPFFSEHYAKDWCQ